MTARVSRRAATIVLALVVTAAVAVVPLGGGLSTAGQYAIATMAFAAVLWVTGALSLPVTALLIPVLLVGFGVTSTLAEAVSGFADPVIFLLLSGFVLAEALQKHDVDRRVAFHLLLGLGTSPRRLVLAVMIATALLSMVISNTATTAMMIPIALGLVGQLADVSTVEEQADESITATNVQVAMVLGIAYAASLGGVGTLIGTPPNAIVVGQLQQLLGHQISFVDWLFVGLPMVAVTLPLAWVLLTYVVYPPELTDVTAARNAARRQLADAGPLSPLGRGTVAVFVATAGLWLLGGLGFLFEGLLPPSWYTTLFGGPGVTVFGTTGHQGVLYFVVVGLVAVAVLSAGGAVTWDDATDIDWGTLLLLGGGISLATALVRTGATQWLAEVTLGALGSPGLTVLLLAVIAFVVLLSELASNTAIAAILAPLLVNVGPAYAAVLGTSNELAAVFLAVAGAVAASYGFALPVATPPNAIAYGTGYVSRAQMLRAGLLLDGVVILTAAGLISLLVRFVWPVVLG